MNINRDYIEDVWNQHAIDYDKKHNDSENPLQWKNMIADLIGKDKEQNVLDIGTGTGFLALIAADLGYRSTGIDLAKKMIEAAQNEANKKNLPVTFLTGDWEKMPFADKSYDVLVNRCILWTLIHPQKTIREWRRVLKDGGSLYCFCASNSTDEDIAVHHYGKEIGRTLPLKGATPEMLLQIIKDCGFQQTEMIDLPHMKDNTRFPGWYMIKAIK
jgi:ubiquinone/menaquinone biosynthesis C-methylase UbiE